MERNRGSDVYAERKVDRVKEEGAEGREMEVERTDNG